MCQLCATPEKRTRRSAVFGEYVAPAGAAPLARPAATRPLWWGRGRPGWKSHASDDDMLSRRQILTAFTSLPRVLKLVWATDAVFTVLLALLYAAQGIVPAATAVVSGQLINDVQSAIGSKGAGGTMT